MEPVEWNNIQYVLDKESGEIRQNVTGSFRQLPLKIAWAITIGEAKFKKYGEEILAICAEF